MLKPSFLSFLFATAYVLQPTAVTAQGFRFLDESVLSRLTVEEIRSFKALVRTTLDASPDTEIILWESADSAKAGKVLPRFSYETNGTICRRTLFQLSDADGRRENFHFDLCQQDDSWVVAEAPARFSGREREQLEAFVIQVLEAGEDGLPVSWTGKRSGHNAVVVPIANPGEIPANCRRAAITVIDSNGQALNGQYQFCKNDQGRWQYQPD